MPTENRCHALVVPLSPARSVGQAFQPAGALGFPAPRSFRATRKSPQPAGGKACPTGRALAVVCLLQLSLSLTMASDWPQWRGPNRNGLSDEKGFLKAWPKTGPELVWRVSDLGR